MLRLFGITWAQAHYFFLLPVLLIIIFLLVRKHYFFMRAISLLVNKQHQKSIFPFFSSRKQRSKLFLFIVALVCIFLALLQPQWGTKEQLMQQEGRDIFILLDISRSMLAEDMRPNRLEFTKLKIRSLLKKLSFERACLIPFSGSAFVQCPLTSDHDAFLTFLDQVNVETISSGTTALDQALQTTLRLLEKSEGRKNKLVILATDGEDFSLHLEAIKRKALQQNIKLFSLGVGTAKGAPIPILDKMGTIIGHEKDATGNVALSRLNAQKLESLSSSLGGCFIKATYTDNDIDEIVRNIQAFEKEKFFDKKISLYEDRYPWFLSIAWMALALEWIL